MNKALEPQLTDQAAELVELGDYIRSIPDNGSATFTVIAGELKLDPNSFEFLDAMAAIGARFAAFSRFINTVDDPFVTPRVRTNTLGAVQLFSRLWRPDVFNSQWTGVKQKYLNDNVLFIIEGFSRTAREHKPLRKLTENDRETLLKNLSSLISDIDNDETIPVWAKQPLSDGLSRLQTIVSSLIFFGHDAAIDQIILMHARSSSLQEALIKGEPDKYPQGHTKIFRILEVIALAGQLFCLPAESHVAIDTYRTWLLGPVIHNAEQIHKQKLLPPPITKEGVAEA